MIIENKEGYNGIKLLPMVQGMSTVRDPGQERPLPPLGTQFSQAVDAILSDFGGYSADFRNFARYDL